MKVKSPAYHFWVKSATWHLGEKVHLLTHYAGKLYF